MIIQIKSTLDEHCYLIEENEDFQLTWHLNKKDSQFYWIYLSDRWDKRPGNLSISQKFSSNIQKNDIIYDIENPSNSKKYKLNIEDDSLSFFSSDLSLIHI